MAQYGSSKTPSDYVYVEVLENSSNIKELQIKSIHFKDSTINREITCTSDKVIYSFCIYYTVI